MGSFTVNKVCGSGLKSVMLAAQAIKAGDAELIVAGGMESMSNAPYFLKEMRWGHKYGDGQLVDGMINDGLSDAYEGFHMGMTGEMDGREVPRHPEDGGRVRLREPHEGGAGRRREGSFRDEIVGVEIERESGERGVFESDECIREDTTLEKLARLKPAFKPDGILTVRELLPVERRRLRPGRRVRGEGREDGQRAAREDNRLRHRGA